jgi:hypothetical protein
VFFLVGFLLSVFLLALSPHHLSGLLSQPASWPQSTLVNIWNWTPPTAGSWRSQWWCYENWSLTFHVAVKGLCTHVLVLSKVSEHRCCWCWRYLVAIVQSTEKPRFEVLTFLLDSWGLGFLLFLLTNVVRSEIDSVTGLLVHVRRRSLSVLTRPSHVSSQCGVCSASFSLFPRTRDIPCGCDCNQATCQESKEHCFIRKEIPGTEMTTMASNSFVWPLTDNP